MFFSLLGISMDFIKHVRVSEERAETGFSTEINGFAAILRAREIGRIRIAENPPAEGHEARVLFLSKGMCVPLGSR
jgi:hypothetical protein